MNVHFFLDLIHKNKNKNNYFQTFALVSIKGMLNSLAKAIPSSRETCRLCSRSHLLPINWNDWSKKKIIIIIINQSFYQSINQSDHFQSTNWCQRVNLSQPFCNMTKRFNTCYVVGNKNCLSTSKILVGHRLEPFLASSVPNGWARLIIIIIII